MIVSNTTPLSSLLKIGRAHLLQALYGTLTIPPEVAAELDQAGPIEEVETTREMDYMFLGKVWNRGLSRDCPGSFTLAHPATGSLSHE